MGNQNIVNIIGNNCRSDSVFGLAKTEKYSAYAECRKVAETTKGYAAWKYERTFQLIFESRVVFSDGYNDLTCVAVGIGPYWTVRGSYHTLVACLESLDNGGGICPEDYFGVAP
jgi:hypothetical protein